MAQYRKKPIVIEAVQCIEVIAVIKSLTPDYEKLPKWFMDAYGKGDVTVGYQEIYIDTIEGEMRADILDWIICGVKGELYPCKPDIFKATYEPVKD